MMKLYQNFANCPSHSRPSLPLSWTGAANATMLNVILTTKAMMSSSDGSRRDGSGAFGRREDAK